jgi:hypothetical protein
MLAWHVPYLGWTRLPSDLSEFEIDSEIRFSWILLGREPANDQELLYLYAALLGHAMDLSAKRLSLMTPGLSVGGLRNALQLLEDGAAMRRSNAAAVEFMHAHRINERLGKAGAMRIRCDEP